MGTGNVMNETRNEKREKMFHKQTMNERTNERSNKWIEQKAAQILLRLLLCTSQSQYHSTHIQCTNVCDSTDTIEARENTNTNTKCTTAERLIIRNIMTKALNGCMYAVHWTLTARPQPQKRSAYDQRRPTRIKTKRVEKKLEECKQKPISRTVVHCLDSRKRSLYVYLFLFFVHI